MRIRAIHTSHSIHTIHEIMKGMENFFVLFFFSFFIFYLKNHHVTNRRFRRSVFLGSDKRNLSHVFRRVSKDRKFFQRIPRDYGQDYDPGVDSSPNTLLNLLSCPFRLGASASWAVVCNKTHKKLDTPGVRLQNLN